MQTVSHNSPGELLLDHDLNIIDASVDTLLRIFISYCKLSLLNLSYVSIPTEETNEEMKENLRRKIKDGTYNIGYMIVPQKY